MSLSVVVVTKNEERRIRPCLNSVVWADEIIVLDAGSTDETQRICKEFTDKVYENADWKGFGQQKNLALEYASKEWVLSLDADEWVSEGLRKEISGLIEQNPPVDAVELSRLSSYLGKTVRHSGWWPDYVARLFRKEKARFSDDLVHERLVFNGKSMRLTQPLIHNSFETPEDVLDKLNRYSTAGAERLITLGKTGGLYQALVHGVWTFLSTYVFKVGFLDGREGFMLAVSNAEGAYYKYLKLGYLKHPIDGNGK